MTKQEWIATFLWLAIMIAAIAIVLACTGENPTEPAPGGEKDEEDRDEIIYTRYDNAYLAADGIHVYTTNFFGNPKNDVVAVPLYAVVLYDEKNEVVRIAFGGFYESIEGDVGQGKRDDIHADEYLRAWAQVQIDDLEDVRPLYYLNVYSTGYNQADAEKIVRSHFARIVLGKIAIETSVTF